MISSRPHSPFKRSSKPPSPFSPGRSSPSKNTRIDRYTEDMSPHALAVGSSRNPNNSAAGPSRTRNSVSAETSYGASLSRAEHYDVVLEGESAAVLPYLGAIVLDQLGSLDDSGLPLEGDFDKLPQSGSASSIYAIKHADTSSNGKKSSVVSADRFESMLQELIQTERNYVKRIKTLYEDYADPLRKLARHRDTTIIPLYEAQRLFGNIGEVLGANRAFLEDLEGYLDARNKKRTCVSLGEVVYNNIACFSGCYNEYFNNFEKAKHIEQTMTKTNKSYREFVDRIKFNTSGIGNVGLRELIMEPVQRIPRYTMLLDGLVKNLPASDPNRSKLEEAIVLASRIANCEVDDKTKRAAVLWSFARNVEGFPAGLISVHRQFIDCIDVDDFPIEVLGPAAMNTLLSPGSSAASSPSYRTLHCTLFLFDDIVVITKRASVSTRGRTLIGLDDLDRLADQMKTFTERSSTSRVNQRFELGFRGMIELADVQAIDIGGPDFQIAMAKGPSHISGEKWSSRLVRQYATVDALSLRGPDPAVARTEKYRFLENLWRAQALVKAKDFRSHVRSSIIPASCDKEKIRRVIYWNVYSRRPYLTEARKSLAVLHIDLQGQADCLPLGFESAPPGGIVRIQAVDEDRAEYIYTVRLKGDASSKEGDEDGELEAGRLAWSSISQQLYKTAKSAALSISDFGPLTARGSPSTPTSSHRGRNLATGLEQFGRSLFGTPNSLRSVGVGSDLFGTRRSKGSSSQASRNASTSTRLTYSTIGTSSIGSRGMLGGAQGMDVPCNDGVMSSVEKYRRMAGEGDETMMQQGILSPLNGDDNAGREERVDNQNTPMSIKRKPVPSDAPQEGISPRRVVSASSKRSLPIDSSPTEKPYKRVADGRRRANTVGLVEEDQYNFRSNSPSPTKRPTGPRPVSRNSSVAPLKVRKDLGQARQLSRPERIQKTWKDVEALREAMVHSRDLLQSLQIQGNVTVQEAEECTLEQENSAIILLRLKNDLASLLEEEEASSSSSAVAVASKSTASAPSFPASEVYKLQAQVSSLTRKADLLTALERDGRLENTELHKAFNEELDHLYEDAGLNEVEQIAKLRLEVKRAKTQRNEANLENKALRRELALERAQGEVGKALLEANGLI
ncbi:hypothetical protein CBS101457_000864 [Exobasidium rhododendri]|nr:hypothetical protein CBS101457_000864 [Exobasidium rhododendri]